MRNLFAISVSILAIASLSASAFAQTSSGITDPSLTTKTGSRVILKSTSLGNGYQVPQISRASRTGATTDCATAASNTAVVLTYAADTAGLAHAVEQVTVSYTATPTAGTFKIEDGSGTVIFGPVAIATAGEHTFVFHTPKRGTANTAMILTLAAGGTTVGQVSATHWTE
jgi:hypothetical protein